MSMTYKPFDQMYKEIKQTVRGRKPGASTPTEDIEYRRIISRVVVHVLSLGIIAAAVQVIFQPQPGSMWAMAGAFVGLLFAIATTRTEIDKARHQWNRVASGQFLIEHLLEERVAAQEKLKALEARVECETHVEELTPADSVIMLAHELKKATKQGRLRDAATIRKQLDVVSRGMHGDATQAFLEKQESTGQESKS